MSYPLINRELARITTNISQVSGVVENSRDLISHDQFAMTERAHSFIERYIKGTTSAKGFTALHPTFIHQMVNTVQSLATGQTLAQTRGNGVVATILGRTRSTGAGLARSMSSIERILGIRDLEGDLLIDTDLEYKVQNNSTYPVFSLLPKSSMIFENLLDNLTSRRGHVDLIQANRENPRYRVPVTQGIKDARRLYLVYGGWEPEKIKSYAIEYMARAFAAQCDPKDLADFVTDKNKSVSSVFGTLKFA